MDEKELQKLYNAVSGRFNVGDFNTFKSKMATTDMRKRFFDVVGQKGFDLGSYSKYEQRLAGTSTNTNLSSGGGVSQKNKDAAAAYAKQLNSGNGQNVVKQLPTKNVLTQVGSKRKLTNEEVTKKAQERLSDPYNQLAASSDDPIGSFNTAIQNSKVSAIEGVDKVEDENEAAIHDKMSELLVNNAFPDAQSASNYLYNELKKKTGKDIAINDVNISDLENELPQNLSTKTAIQKVANNRFITSIMNESKDFNEFIGKYKNSSNKFNGLGEDDEAQSQAYLQILNDADVIDAAKQDPEKWKQYLQERHNFNNRYPELAKQNLASKISQYREDVGKNNKIFNNPSKESWDKTVDEMAKKGLIDANDKAFYNQNIKPSDLKTTGFLESVGRGYEEGIRQIGNTIGLQDLGLLSDKSKEAQVNPTNNKILGGGGHLMGNIVPMLLTGGALKGAGFSEKAANGFAAMLQFGGGNADQAKKYYPNNPIGQFAYTTLGTTIDTLLMDLPMRAQAGIKQLLSGEIKAAATKLSDNAISDAVKEQVKQSFFKKAAGAFSRYGIDIAKHNVQTAGVLTSIDLLHKGLNLAAGDKRAFEGTDVPQELVDNFLMATPLSALSAVGAFSPKQKSELNTAINELPENMYTGEIKKALNDGDVSKLETYLKDVAEQLSNPQSETFTRKVFGEKLSDIATKLYPNAKSEPITIDTTPTTNETGAEVRDTENEQAGVNTTDNGLQDGNSGSGKDVGGEKVEGKKDYELTSAEYEKERQASIPIFNEARHIAGKIFNWSGTDGLYQKYLESKGIKPNEKGVFEDTSINDVEDYMKFLLKEKADFFSKEDYDTYLKYKNFMDRGILPDWSNHETKVSIALSEGKKVPKEVLDEYPDLIQPTNEIPISTDKNKKEDVGGEKVEKFKDVMDAADNRLVDAIVHRVGVKGMEFDKAVEDAIKRNRESYDENRRNTVIERAKKQLTDLGIFDSDLEKEISNYKLDTQQGLNKYKNQLANTKRNLTTFEKEPEKYSSQISLAKETIANQERVLDYLAKKTNQPTNEIPISTEEKSNTIKEANTVEPKASEGEKQTEPIVESNEGQPPSKEPPVGSKGIYVERPATELSHRGLQDVANEFSLSDVESRDTKTDIQLRQDAENTINDWKEKGEYGNKIEELTKKAENKGVLNDEERVIMEQHLANVIGEARKLDKNSPEYDAKLQEIKRLKDAGEITRSAAGAALRIPTNSGSYPRTVEDAMVDRMNALGAETLTVEQKKDVEEKFAELEKNLADEKAKREDAERKNAELQAQLEVANAKKAIKPAKKDFKKEREDIRASIREKLKKSRSQANDVTTAIVDFAKIAPDVAKLMKSYVEEGIVTFSELIDKLHNDLKEDAPEIKRGDIVDIVAGKYDAPKETKIDLLNKLKSIKDKKSAEAIKIKAKLESGDFEKKAKPKSWIDNPEFAKKYPKEYKETLDAIRRAEDAKHEMALANLKAEMEQRTKWQKAVAHGGKTLRTAKALKAGIDFSATLVQNLLAIMAHPIVGAKGSIEAFKDFASAGRFERGLARLHNSEAWSLIEQSGLSVVDPKSLRENEKNDIFNDTFFDDMKIKGKSIAPTKPFERHFTSLGNYIRTNLFLRKAEQLMQEGKTFETHPEDFKSVAATINNMTGRGTMTEGLESHNELLSSILWSPRLLASTLNVLGVGDAALAMTGKKGFYRSLTPSQRAYAVKEISKGVGMGIAVMAAIAYATGGKADLNPTSVTFGTVQNGDDRWTVFGRFTSVIRMLAMLVSRQRTTEKGTQELDSSRNGATTGNELWKFVRGKLNPSLSYGVDIATNTTFNGGKPTLRGELENALYPMSVNDIVTGIKQDGLHGLFVRGIPATFGAKVSNEKDFIQTNTFQQKARINGEERIMTDSEFQKFAERKKEIEQSEIERFKKRGLYVVENGQSVFKTYSQLTSKQRQDKINAISIAASKRAKEQVFVSQDKSNQEKRASGKADKLNDKLYK